MVNFVETVTKLGYEELKELKTLVEKQMKALERIERLKAQEKLMLKKRDSLRIGQEYVLRVNGTPTASKIIEIGVDYFIVEFSDHDGDLVEHRIKYVDMI